MRNQFSIAVTGDSIIMTKISVHVKTKFLPILDILRDADVAYTHLETLIHDYDGPEIYPAAEGGLKWMRSPHFVAEELKWAGFDIVSHASNHSLDYSYGGLFSTWKALDEAGLPHAGTGMTLRDARAPAYLDTAKGRVALISMCSSCQGWARAGEMRPDLKGRPGVNTLRFYHVVDSNTLDMIKQIAIRLGWWVEHTDKTWLFNPPGLHMSFYRFVEGNQPGISVMADESDVEGNLQSIREARGQADWVLVHLHNHEWDPNKGLSVPAEFVPAFARACIDSGADLFIGEGSHADLRGVEVYKNKAIFYDPGDFISTSFGITKQPSDYYAKKTSPKPFNPAGGYHSAPISGGVVAVCNFSYDRKLVEVKLHPFTIDREPRPDGTWPHRGIPILADVDTARKTIEYLAELSSPFGTMIDFRDGVGLVRL